MLAFYNTYAGNALCYDFGFTSCVQRLVLHNTYVNIIHTITSMYFILLLFYYHFIFSIMQV